MSTFGDFRALGTPGGDLGFQGSILGPNTGRKSTFCHHCGTVFGHFWVLFLDHVFDNFGMIPRSILGSFSSHL